MKTFSCQCGIRLFFENTQCLACGRDVGWCEGCQQISSFGPAEQHFVCDSCGENVQKCHNFSVENVCNRFITATSEDTTEPHLCSACVLTETIPDLALEANRVKWRRLEQAKRRLLYQLDFLKLPYRNISPGLTFDFKGNILAENCIYRKGEKTEVVYTGHADGKITINIDEADDVKREQIRVDMNEAHRTLIGHFRHEVGHYYWQLLIQGQNEEEFIDLFGDHTNPDYGTALTQYYTQGPRPDWPLSYVSAYSTAHPWEDFAEIFALYLDIRSVLDTALHLKLPLPPIKLNDECTNYIIAFQQLGIIVNEINRCLGIFDLVPEIIAEPVAQKLTYVHKLVLNPTVAMNSNESTVAKQQPVEQAAIEQSVTV
jgi:hypothetical protein